MKKWLVVYHHRHGHDFYFVESPDWPSEEAMVKTFPSTDWELDREDEYLIMYDITNVEFDRLAA